MTVEWTSARTFGVAPEGPGERVLATVLFSDIVDSTSILERIGDTAWRDLLVDHNRLVRDELNTFRGREIATTGDGFLVVFDGPTRAVRCGAAMAQSARGIGLAIRVGIHTGELEFVGPDARGVAVHAAARVMSFAEPGDVLVSSTTKDPLDGSGVRGRRCTCPQGIGGRTAPVQADRADRLARSRLLQRTSFRDWLGSDAGDVRRSPTGGSLICETGL